MNLILRRIIYTGLFLVPLIPFLVSTVFFFPFITTKVFAWRIIVEIIFAAWILLAFLDTNSRPKRSLIFYSILGFLVVIGLADLFGTAPLKSFWSNFERMEGYISLLHLGMFFLVISSVFKEVDWKRWWNVSLAASFVMVIFSVLQIIGLKTINQGGVRVDGTFGNAIYLAVYMLFHIFIASLFMWREWKNVTLRWVYGLLIFSQIFILYFTATRGAILGLLGGIFVFAVLSIFNMNKAGSIVRKSGIVILLTLTVLVGSFISLRKTEFVISSPVLSRFASLNVEELKTQGRFFIWPIAFEGFKERPVLGWGQENFSDVFQKYYSPEMYRLEPWFDRAHNIFLDWAIAGGLLGLVSYLVLYFALLYSIWRFNDQSNHLNVPFSYTEKSILTGLVVAYFVHNFFVFDHLVSYILFFSLLAYVHYRNNSELLWVKSISVVKVWYFALPITLILLASMLYFFNIRPMMTNVYLIETLKSLQAKGGGSKTARYIQKAHNTSRLGRPEVIEQITENLSTILTSDMTTEEKTIYFNFAKEAVLGQAKEAIGDSRYQLVAGRFLSTAGFLDEALVYFNRARELIPGKQQVYFELGAVYINKKEILEAYKIFRVAYELEPTYIEAKIIYLIGAIYASDKTVENEILGQLSEREIILDDRIISAYHAGGRIDMVISLLEGRIRIDPENTERYKALLKQVQG